MVSFGGGALCFLRAADARATLRCDGKWSDSPEELKGKGNLRMPAYALYM